MKCVITDGFWMDQQEAATAELAAIAGEAAFYPRTAPEEVIERCKDAEILIVNKVVIGKEQMDRLPKLRYVGVAATGYNVVDVAEAAKRGIVVTNVPAYSTDSVAQTVFAFILEHAMRVQRHSDSVAAGEWAASPYFSYWKTPLIELAGKTLGIVGLGRIGRKVAEIGHAFGMTVIGVSRTVKSDLPDYIRQASLDEVLAQSDFLTLHCPLTDASRGLINLKTLAKMKKTAMLINTSRGPVVDETALADALNGGRLAAAAVDVLAQEPPREHNPLADAPECLVTPHYAWATVEARSRLWSVIVNNVKAFVDGRPVNVVN